ncbi:MAG: polymer-forming cytoskeletal protein [Spirochaetales bacterium]|nr:polymer-forming cytoskeletal protein [Spirochaetales bacterium]
MQDNLIPDGTLINSIIGEGTRFKGEFDLNGLLRIDGDFSGVIRTKGKVLVGSNGRVECTMYAGTVVIGGMVRGDIYSTEKVIILSTGMVIGNIQTPRLIVEDGVIFNGNCKIVEHATVRESENEGSGAVLQDNHRNNEDNNNKSPYQKNDAGYPPPLDEKVISL